MIIRHGQGRLGGHQHYSGALIEAQGRQCRSCLFGGLHAEAGLIIRQMRDQGLNAPMMSGDGITDKEFAQIGGPGFACQKAVTPENSVQVLPPIYTFPSLSSST